MGTTIGSAPANSFRHSELETRKSAFSQPWVQDRRSRPRFIGCSCAVFGRYDCALAPFGACTTEAVVFCRKSATEHADDKCRNLPQQSSGNA